jgi:hypothetical protein
MQSSSQIAAQLRQRNYLTWDDIFSGDSTNMDMETQEQVQTSVLLGEPVTVSGKEAEGDGAIAAFQHLVTMPLQSLTSEASARLSTQAERAKTAVLEMERVDGEDLWKRDITELLDTSSKLERKEREATDAMRRRKGQ